MLATEEMLKQLLPLALSVNTIAVMWLAGNKNLIGWVLGLLGQVGWIAFMIVFEAWGLAPLTVALIVVYGRNLVRWRREQRESRLQSPPLDPISVWGVE